MNIIKRIKNKIQYEFYKKIKPEIIGGWKNANGVFSQNTGISNMSRLSSQKDNLFIGDNVYIGHFNYIDAVNAKVFIGNNVQITTNVTILTHSGHHLIRLINNPNKAVKNTGKLSFKNEIYIGENTFIGPYSIVMPGTKIGKGCIISAYSYVKGEIPDFSVVRGQPAKIIGNTTEIDKNFLEKYPELIETYYLNGSN
ncbi:MAG: acyltransferase [Bacteroidetes bacterium]|nr:acyltransferase [Bacteroidota bacterium]